MHGLPRDTRLLQRSSLASKRLHRLLAQVYETPLLGQRTVFLRGEHAVTDLFRQSETLRGWWPATVSLVEDLVSDLHQGRIDQPMTPVIRGFAFEVIATTVLGLGHVDREALFQGFERWTRGLFSFPLAWSGSPLAQARAARKQLLQRLAFVLRLAQDCATRWEPIAAGGLDRLAGELDEEGLPLRDADVVEQLLLLLFAGCETMASSLSCLMLALLQHPAHESWLREELDQLPSPPTPAEAVTAYDTSRAPRLDAVVKEVMLLTPPCGRFLLPRQESGCCCRRGDSGRVDASGEHRRHPPPWAVP